MDTKFLSFDIDETLLDNTSHQNGFYRTWTGLKFNKPPLLCYNTGRLLDDTRKLVQSHQLPEPDYIISGVGTNIYDYKNKQTLKEFSQVLEEGWDRERVQGLILSLGLPISPQPDHFQNPYKSSWFYDDAAEEDIQSIERALDRSGLEVSVIYSSARHLDVLPKLADKGNALEWLLSYLDIPAEACIVAGDSGNDSAMFRIEGIKGIVVGNAQPELYQATKNLPVYFSERPRFHAVLEGLRYYELEFEELAEVGGDGSIQELPPYLNLLELEEIKGIDRQQLDTILEGYEQALGVIRKNITPMGFSACSIADNDVLGTDENYNSVWARDGSIIITGTAHLQGFDDIHECQRNTLETLAGTISANGQVPSNVSISTGKPDYSGVGGICSIDSGLWYIIAFHDYVKASRDINFLRQHFPTLLRIMDWLGAQDGNNDALLEIPEAGDWTDLFGRSYNILYDEVLWYRANICFGRLLELLGVRDKAGDYLRWSQLVKREILLNFWPTTKNKLYQSMTFAEQQYALGDARYLIAQVTPFDFSWRCDVYGNLLAFLYDVIDKEKAHTTFRFMWGSGVNFPYPVSNVYPAVTAGDPDWRPYYTVNLLNLPHHYHNGGLWPFIGGCWVRFINKLGIHDLALQELHKLAELNKMGIYREWEFNEWAHGKTGRPMGKAFQAWSASEYILACHDLKLIN